VARGAAPSSDHATRGGGGPLMALLSSLRSLILGETWTIPIGVAGAVLIAALLRSAVSEQLWDELGGFVLAVIVAVTLVASIARSARH
jgi:hypothetical protein